MTMESWVRYSVAAYVGLLMAGIVAWPDSDATARSALLVSAADDEVAAMLLAEAEAVGGRAAGLAAGERTAAAGLAVAGITVGDTAERR